MSRQANPINIQAIDHVVIRAIDIDTMIDFYSNVLGCRLERTLDDLGLAQLRAGDSLIDLVDVSAPLGTAGGGAPQRDAANMDHLCLRVIPWNTEAIVTHLEAAGVAVGDVGNRYGARGSGPSIYIEDPEGNTVELKGSD